MERAILQQRLAALQRDNDMVSLAPPPPPPSTSCGGLELRVVTRVPLATFVTPNYLVSYTNSGSGACLALCGGGVL